MPRDDVQEIAKMWPVERVDIDQVKSLATAFRVSHRAAALRLIQLGLADRSLYSSVEALFRVKATKKDGTPTSPPRPDLRMRQYGPRTMRIVLQALPPMQARSVLRVDAQDVRELATKVAGVTPD